MMQLTQAPVSRHGWLPVLWRGLVRLDFLSNFFTWLMELLARVAEPLASISAIYLIIVAGVPALFNEQLHTGALAMIVGSPELLVVGAFKIATRELNRGNRKGWGLMVACVLLLVLTALTVGDLFLWHWGPDAVNALMGCRCLAVIAYTFTRGIVTDEAQGEPMRSLSSSPVNQLAQQFTETVNLIRSHVAEVHQAMLAEVHRVNTSVHSELARVNQGVHSELLSVQAVLAEQSQALLAGAIERLEHTQSQRLQAVYSRLEQVTISLERGPVTVPTGIVHAVNQQSEPCELLSEPVHSTVHSESKVNQARAFTVNHYRAQNELPTLAMIMTQAACSKSLASRAYNLARVDLSLVESSTQ